MDFKRVYLLPARRVWVAYSNSLGFFIGQTIEIITSTF